MSILGLGDFTRRFSCLCLPALLCLAALAPPVGRAEGDYWIPLYNKLVRMFNERALAAGAATLPLVDADGPVAAWFDWREESGGHRAQAGLSRLRREILHLATNYYVRHLDDQGEPIDLDGMSRPRLWIEYKQPEEHDRWGNRVLAEGTTFFDLIRLRGPQSLRDSLVDAPAWPLAAGRNAFCRLPPSYGDPSYSNRLANGYQAWGGSPQGTSPNDYTTAPVIWEHFQEIYEALLLLEWTWRDGQWIVPADDQGQPLANSVFWDGGFGASWDEAVANARPAFSGEVACPPEATFAGQHWRWRWSEGGIVREEDMFLASVWRSFGVYQVEVPGLPDLGASVEFFARGAAFGVWDDNGAGLAEGVYRRWGTVAATGPGPVVSPVLGDPGLSLPVACEPPAASLPDDAEDGVAMADASRGCRVDAACAILKWEFADWKDLEPTTITIVDFVPPPDDGVEDLIDDCGSCDAGCGIEAGTPGQPEAPVDWRLPLGRSSALAEPRIGAELRLARTRLPLSGLWFDRSPEGTFLFLNLESRWLAWNQPMITEVDGVVTTQSFRRLLRGNGRIVTLRLDPATGTAAVVGPDAHLDGRQLAMRGDQLHFLEQDVYHGGSQVGRENREFASRYGNDGFDRLSIDWEADRLATASHTVEMQRDTPGGRVVAMVWHRLEDGLPLHRVELEPALVDGAVDPLVKGFPARTRRYRNAPLADPPEWTLEETVDLVETADGWQVERWRWERRDPYRREALVRVGAALVQSRSDQTGGERRRTVVHAPKPWSQEVVVVAEWDATDPTIDTAASGLAPTTFEYYDDRTKDGAAYGRLRLATYPDGGWEECAYDARGRPARISRPFGDALPGGAVRATEYRYESVDPWLEGGQVPAGSLLAVPAGRAPDDGTIRPGLPRIEIETVAGMEVGRTYRIVRRHQEQIVRAAPGAAVDAPGNLVSVAVRRDVDGRLASVVHPDGAFETYGYAVGDDALATTVATPAAILTTVVDARGRTLESRSTRAGSPALFARVVHSNADGWGRFQDVDYLDGSRERTVFGCCGPAIFVDREGIETHCQYDEEGRLVATERNGIATRREYDVDGNLLSVWRFGAGQGAGVQLAGASYDWHGRRIASWSPAGGAVAHVEGVSPGGGRLRVDTYADGGTRMVEHYRDSRLKRISGSAARPVDCEYGVERVDGVWCEYAKTIRPGAGGADDEWSKTYTDCFGGGFLTVHADGAEYRSFYNDRGQLVRAVDPDGATVLHAYDAVGRREIEAVDLDDNGRIDYEVDQIAKTVVDVGFRATPAGDVPVERVRTWIWREGAASETDGTLVSVSETSAGGAMAWHAAFGRESHTRTEIDPVDRTRTVTSVAADGTSTVVRHRDGQLVATASYAVDGALLAEATYAYDAHDRQQAVIRNPGTPTELTTTLVYDSADRIVSTTVAAGGLSQTTVHEYDEMGRRVRTVLPGGIVQHAAYDRRGQLVAAWGDQNSVSQPRRSRKLIATFLGCVANGSLAGRRVVEGDAYSVVVRG